DNPAVDVSTIGNNKNCLCKMTYPNLGGSWVFGAAFAAAAMCANHCAYYCAQCVQNGTKYSCSRSAVLALP
ncbi:MAG: hypothetical protein LBT45_02235, partial [Rickettsiales bacterium]|nr:hypothetical protein [Rickettsiales bacterium]